MFLLKEFSVKANKSSLIHSGSFFNLTNILIRFLPVSSKQSPLLAHVLRSFAPLLEGILGGLVPCCLDLSLAHQYGECLCMPLLPGSTFAIRVGIRERYKIRVSVYICMQMDISKQKLTTCASCP